MVAKQVVSPAASSYLFTLINQFVVVYYLLYLFVIMQSTIVLPIPD